MSLTNVQVREIVSANAESTYVLALSLGGILANLVPLIVICIAIATAPPASSLLPPISWPCSVSSVACGQGQGALHCIFGVCRIHVW